MAEFEEKKLEVVAPEGYEIDRENSTLECIRFKKRATSVVVDGNHPKFKVGDIITDDGVNNYRVMLTPKPGATICYKLCGVESLRRHDRRAEFYKTQPTVEKNYRKAPGYSLDHDELKEMGLYGFLQKLQRLQRNLANVADSQIEWRRDQEMTMFTITSWPTNTDTKLRVYKFPWYGSKECVDQFTKMLDEISEYLDIPRDQLVKWSFSD